MSTITLYIDDLEDSANYYADTTGMDDDDKRAVLDTLCTYLTRMTDHVVGWRLGWAPHGMSVDGMAHFTSNDPEYAIVEAINETIERTVNAPWYDGPDSLDYHEGAHTP